MLTTYRLALTLVLAVLACVPARLPAQDSPVAQQSIEQAVRAVHAQLRQAAGRLDAQELYGFVLDTPVPPIIEDGRVEATRAIALANTTSGFQGLTSISYSYTREHVTVLSPSSALWIGEGTAAARLADGREIAVPFAETLVFVLRNGQWKILHAHRSAPNQR